MATKKGKLAVKSAPTNLEKIKSEQEKIISGEAEKQKILRELKNVANKNTSLRVAPFSKKPIAYLNQLTPFIKVTLKLPKPPVPGKGQKFKITEYDHIDLFFNPTGKDSNSYFNNYIKAFEYTYEGGGWKCSLSISDISFDFSDMLLLRFRSLEDTNLTFMDVTFGWTTPEYNMRKQKDGIIFQNTVTFQVQEMTEEDSVYEREIKLSGVVTSTFPDAAGLVTPYSIFGPYPLITYNFIKYLVEPFDVQLSLMGLTSKDPVKNPPKIPAEDIKGKAEFVRNLYLAGKILGKEDPLKKKTKKQWLDLIFGKSEAKVGGKEEEIFPTTSFAGSEIDELKKIFKPGTSGEKTLNSKVITEIYNSEVFYAFVKGKIQTSASVSENPIRYLVSRVAPICKELKLHPWEAMRYFYYSMIEVVRPNVTKSGSSSDSPDYNFIEMDFADVIDYSGSEGGPGAKTGDLKALKMGEKIIGYKSESSEATLQTNQEDPYIKLFGITGDSISVGTGTTWEQLIQSAASKVKVDIGSLLNSKDAKDFKDASEKFKKTKIPKGGVKAEDNVKEENNMLFIKQFGNKKNLAFKFANLNAKMFFASAQTRKTMCETIQLMLEKKYQNNTNARERLNQIETERATLTETAAADNLTTTADKNIGKVLNDYIKMTTPNSLVLSFFLDRAGCVFGEGFGENNIVQVYNVRFKNSNVGFSQTAGGPSGTALSMEFPDVVSFKPTIKNLFDHVRNILPLIDMFAVEKDGPNKKISSTMKDHYGEAATYADKSISEKTAEISKAKTAEEKKSSILDLRTKYTDKIKSDQDAADSQNIKVLEPFSDNDSNNLRKWKERARFPIHWNSDPRQGNGFLDGDTDADAALMKTSITNLKRRMIIHSMTYEAELRILGDATFAGTYFNDKLIYIKVLNADGRDSIHTGIYRITGYTHSITSGSYYTTFKLTKSPDLNSGDYPQFEAQMIESLSRDSLTQSVLPPETVFDIAASNDAQTKRIMLDSKNTIKELAIKNDPPKATTVASMKGSIKKKKR